MTLAGFCGENHFEDLWKSLWKVLNTFLYNLRTV